MKILITGGGTGGHFYPLIAVVKSIRDIARREKLIDPKIYYTGPEEFNGKELFENDIAYVHISAGKRRINAEGFSKVLNFIDIFKMGIGVFEAIIKIFIIMPDVIFAKGGYASFPTLWAARFYGIPVIIHESDSAPGRVTVWASKFAKRIALSYKECAEYFDKAKVAVTGQPVKPGVAMPIKLGAYEYLGFKENKPIIAVLGGSLGSKKINDIIVSCLPKIIDRYQIIHQTGKKHLDIVRGMSKLTLEGFTHPENYKAVDYLSPMMLRMIGGVSSIIISRAGSGIFEIAAWGVPSILIPITDSNNDHQRKNAYNYARAGGAKVIEEANLSAQILINELETVLNNQALHDSMSASALAFYKNDASDIIASELIKIALSHYQ